ncbi:hypothetical protein SRABI89_05045 [Pseudomonas koreensis]|nr:hypothetical protein SRABI89_05045 [Pseudomonas koreensis]
MITAIISAKPNATPSLPPANMVAVKNVKPSNTIAVEARPLRACMGTSLSG